MKQGVVTPQEQEEARHPQAGGRGQVLTLTGVSQRGSFVLSHDFPVGQDLTMGKSKPLGLI